MLHCIETYEFQFSMKQMKIKYWLYKHSTAPKQHYPTKQNSSHVQNSFNSTRAVSCRSLKNQGKRAGLGEMKDQLFHNLVAVVASLSLFGQAIFHFTKKSANERCDSKAAEKHYHASPKSSNHSY